MKLAKAKPLQLGQFAYFLNKFYEVPKISSTAPTDKPNLAAIVSGSHPLCAKFITVFLGNILTMPGLSKEPNVVNIDLINDEIVGLF